jgi:hypothetical protein
VELAEARDTHEEEKTDPDENEIEGPCPRYRQQATQDDNSSHDDRKLDFQKLKPLAEVKVISHSVGDVLERIDSFSKTFILL